MNMEKFAGWLNRNEKQLRNIKSSEGGEEKNFIQYHKKKV